MRRLFVALLAGALLACGGEPPRNLLLVSVDTLRGDHLGYAGHIRPTSPNLDALAAESVVFENAYSAAGWTLPSMASVMTGQYPQRHGATRFTTAIDRQLPTLALLLREHDYQTKGYVSHVALTKRYGLQLGFDVFDASVLEVGNPHAIATAHRLTNRAIAELDALDASRPFFIWLHYFDPHQDYLSHADWSHFGSKSAERYDGEIAWTDREIGRLFDALRDRGLWDDTLVVFTSDHGEEFGEHGGTKHDSLHEEILRVPLLIRDPARSAAVRGELAHHVDLLPTLLAALELPASRELPGIDLLGAPAPDRPLFFERDIPTGFRQRAVRIGQHKLLWVEEDAEAKAAQPFPEPEPEPAVRPGLHVYDLAADPGERSPVSALHGKPAQQLSAALRRHFEDALEAPEQAEVDEELRARLRALGYLQ